MFTVHCSSVAGKFSPAVILCSSSRVVPWCMQAAEGAHCIIPTAPLCHTIEQEVMAATKSSPSDKSS